ncbi:MAG: DUF1343 domain-containing protein [Candidatus Marinimicrobia bacterium]|nr:DUF1343 domain-containing protein [Candidatus Neomarinimicrobiota bacterium]
MHACSTVPKPEPLPEPPTITPEFTLTGLDVLEREEFYQLKNLSIGLVINRTSINRKGVPILDLLNQTDSIHITKIFTPEHGFMGTSEAGESVADDTLSALNIPVISLYGNHKKPSAEELDDVDVLVFDMADVGSRYYTYLSTLTYVMEAAAVSNIPVIVLDRPNPIGGSVVEGPILLTNFRSFVGMHPIPTRHGMTIGELAKMINESGWIRNGAQCDLTVIPMENWYRPQWFDETNLSWIPPSPNIPDDTTALIYNGLCLLEGTNISEGRGTHDPFKQFGAPWMDGDSLTSILNQLSLPGVRFSSVDFTPESIPGKAKWAKYLDQPCGGCRITITDRESFLPLQTAVMVISIIKEKYPDQFEFMSTDFIDLLYGSDELKKNFSLKNDPSSLFRTWEKDVSEFLLIREKFLLYE